MFKKRILIGCYEIPGHGGASTSAYNLFRFMQEDGFNVQFVNIMKPEHEVYYKYRFGEYFGNPRHLENVYNCVLNRKLFPTDPHPSLVKLIKELNPDLILGVHHIAALLMKEAVPEIPLIFYASGCMQLKELLVQGSTQSFVSFHELIKNSSEIPTINDNYEKRAVNLSNLIITHSEIIKYLYEYFYSSDTGKIFDEVIWKAEWIYKDANSYSDMARPFEEREIDVVFISSSWNRTEKNYGLVADLVKGLKKYNVHIIGNVDKKFDFITYHNLVTGRSKLFSLIGNAKTIISPSKFDPAPGVLFEASALGCNIVASKNCGNWEICNEELLVDPYTLENFLEKIKISLTNKYDDNISYFLETESYRNLLNIFSVL